MAGPATLSRLSESSWAGAVVLAAGPAVVLAAGPAVVLAAGPAAVLATGPAVVLAAGLAAAPLPFPLGPSAVAVGALAPSTPPPTAAAPPLACPPESSAPLSPAMSWARFAANWSTSLPPTSTMTPRPN